MLFPILKAWNTLLHRVRWTILLTRPTCVNETNISTLAMNRIVVKMCKSAEVLSEILEVTCHGLFRFVEVWTKFVFCVSSCDLFPDSKVPDLKDFELKPCPVHLWIWRKGSCYMKLLKLWEVSNEAQAVGFPTAIRAPKPGPESAFWVEICWTTEIL